jgi:pimeloyl-ACP methyl ester carboxylesterase
MRDRSLAAPFCGRGGVYAARLVSGERGHADLLAEVDRGFRSLPERYLGAAPGFDATFHVRLGDVGHTWEVRCTTHGARVRKGITRRRPDVVIGTDARTWQALREGEFSGIEAFSQRRLYATGDLDLAVGVEGMFRLPNGRPPLQRLREVAVSDDVRVSTVTMGEGRDVILIHGLGATKTSFYFTAAALARAGYRVHAVDLPGFGGSSKPVPGPYSPRWFASTIRGVMDVLEIDQAHFVGNSMGGRVAIELALTSPERVLGLALLCPAVAFVERPFHPFLRFLRPELALLPHRLPRLNVETTLLNIFADRDALDPWMADIVVEEFLRLYRSRGARLAFLSAARNLYLDPPFGRRGFYTRLAGLEAPALFIWASHDWVIPASFKHHVARWLPSAEQIVIDACGHAPQVERPEQINGLIRRFLAQTDALGLPSRYAGSRDAVAA